MTADIYRLLFDFGTLVLIWLVQLVIYPGLCHYPKERLTVWHKIYTQQVSLVIVPLMFGQVIFCAIQLYNQISVYTVGSAVIIFVLWALTFFRFVPLHNAIAAGNNDPIIPLTLVRQNWIRTLLWNILFFWTLSQFYGLGQN